MWFCYNKVLWFQYNFDSLVQQFCDINIILDQVLWFQYNFGSIWFFGSKVLWINMVILLQSYVVPI